MIWGVVTTHLPVWVNRGRGLKFFDISSLRNHSFEFFGSDFACPLPLMIRIFPFSAFQMVRSSVPAAIDV